MQEIFLGVRRPPRPRRLLRRFLLVLFVTLLLLALAWFGLSRATRAHPPVGSLPPEGFRVEGNRLLYGGSSLERFGELWVLRMAGEPFALGAAQARLLGAGVGDPAAILD